MNEMSADDDIIKSISIAFLLATSSGKVDEAFNLYVGENFHHHNIYFKDDADSLRHAMAENAALFPHLKLVVKQMIREENVVAVYSHVKMKPGDAGYALVHIFRFEQDKIAEMWDIAQEIPAGAVNETGMF